MTSPIHWQLSVMRFFSGILACGLLFSFGLHSIQVPHAHYNASHFGDSGEHQSNHVSIGEYLHVSDKKIVSILFLTTIAWYSLLGITLRTRETLAGNLVRRGQLFQKMSFHRYRLFNFMSAYLKNGVIHSKVY